MGDDELVGVKEAARLIGRSQKTVQHWADTGHLPAAGRRGVARLFRPADVREAATRFAVPACPEGHVGVLAAAADTGVPYSQILALITAGAVRGVRLGVAGNRRVFVHAADLAAWAAKAAPAVPADPEGEESGGSVVVAGIEFPAAVAGILAARRAAFERGAA